MISGSACVGSRPTLVRTSFFVRVVPIAVGPTSNGTGFAERTGPYPEPVASSVAGAPSEAMNRTWACCPPRPVGANLAVPLTDPPGGRLIGKGGFPAIWKVKSWAGTSIDCSATAFLLVFSTVKVRSLWDPRRTWPKSRVAGSTVMRRSTPLPFSSIWRGWPGGGGAVAGGEEVDLHREGLVGREIDLPVGRIVEGGGIGARGSVDGDVGLRLPVVVGEREGRGSALVHHHVAEVDDGVRDGGEAADRVAAQAHPGIRPREGRGQVERAVADAERRRLEHRLQLHRLAGTELRRQPCDLEVGNSRGARDHVDGGCDDAVVAEEEFRRLLASESDVAEVERARLDGHCVRKLTKLLVLPVPAPRRRHRRRRNRQNTPTTTHPKPSRPGSRREGPRNVPSVRPPARPVSRTGGRGRSGSRSA